MGHELHFSFNTFSDVFIPLSLLCNKEEEVQNELFWHKVIYFILDIKGVFVDGKGRQFIKKTFIFFLVKS